jgi:hypothetical protein
MGPLIIMIPPTRTEHISYHDFGFHSTIRVDTEIWAKNAIGNDILATTAACAVILVVFIDTSSSAAPIAKS